jgi:hypothetical protein
MEAELIGGAGSISYTGPARGDTSGGVFVVTGPRGGHKATIEVSWHELLDLFLALEPGFAHTVVVKGQLDGKAIVVDRTSAGNEDGPVDEKIFSPINMVAGDHLQFVYELTA